MLQLNLWACIEQGQSPSYAPPPQHPPPYGSWDPHAAAALQHHNWLLMQQMQAMQQQLAAGMMGQPAYPMAYPPQYAAAPPYPHSAAPSGHARARAHVLRGRASPPEAPAHHLSPPQLLYPPAHYPYHPYPSYAPPPPPPPPPPPHPRAPREPPGGVDVDAVLASADTRAHERRLRLMNGDGLFRGSALEKVMRHDEQSKLASARYRPSSTGVPAGMESI